MTEDGLRGAATAPQRVRALRSARMSRRWTEAREAVFFAELAATANVTHAAEQAGMSSASAHNRRRSEPGFALRWLQALDQGYAELEVLMLRQSLEGTERTEVVTDGEGTVKQVKTVRSFPHATAMRLLQSHRETVERYRAMAAMRGHDPAVIERVRAELAKVRARLAVRQDD